MRKLREVSILSIRLWLIMLSVVEDRNVFIGFGKVAVIGDRRFFSEWFRGRIEYGGWRLEWGDSYNS